MATARTRRSILPGPTGQVITGTASGTNTALIPFTIKDSQCKDVGDNYGGNNPLEINTVVKRYIAYNGRVGTDTNFTQYVDFIDDNARNTSPGHLISWLSLKSISGSELGARTNPNKPSIDLPVFFVELKDFPSMMRQTERLRYAIPETVRLIRRAGEGILARDSGRGIGVTASAIALSRSAGAANLSYSFGWAPLISDLSKVLGFAEHYDRKVKQLTKLLKEGTLRRRINVDESSRSEVYNSVYFQSSRFSSSGTVVRTTNARRWAVARWETTASPPGSEPSQVDVLRSLLGLDITPGQLWAILPWSWMVDYFTDVGNYLDAHRNTIPVRLVGGSYMTEFTTTDTRTRVKKPTWLSGGSGSATVTSKYRTPLTLSPLPSGLPFLDAPQVGILASLSVSRRNAWKL